MPPIDRFAVCGSVEAIQGWLNYQRHRPNIERKSRLGTLARTWDEVKMVRRYRRGYLLMFAKGGIPIPFRCLDQHQQERLRAYTAARGHADSVI
jgi:hypothetical protein